MDKPRLPHRQSRLRDSSLLCELGTVVAGMDFGEVD